jgi:hypothetical protein
MLGRLATATVVGALTVALGPGVARAQTWSNARQGPDLVELFAIDRTGETDWVYGLEDVAGDGLDTFAQQEQSIDIRTAYASTDATQFWARVYVSDTAAPGGNITAYVFIDTDRNASSGGSAAATVIDPSFDSDTSNGGYEYVLGFRGNQSITGIWEFTAGAWAPKTFPPPQAAAEAGTFLDPIRLNGDVHGYLQGKVNLDVVGLTQACSANLYVRTTNNTGKGDLEVGQIAPCVPADSNQNGVPDPIEQAGGCTTDAQCANGGVCVNGACIFARACAVEADCPNGYTCTNGRCVVKPTGTTCSATTECNGLVCTGGQCVACTPGGTECGSGYVCGPDGRCTNSSGTGPTGVTVAPGDEIQGGACACTMPGASGRGAFASALLALPLALFARRRRRRQSH